MTDTCLAICQLHTSALSKRSLKTDKTGWVLRHCQAWTSPRTAREKAIKASIEAFALLADSYADETEGERMLGDDGYFHEHAADMIKALRALLNFNAGRYDCGTLDRLIGDLATAAHVDLEA